MAIRRLILAPGCELIARLQSCTVEIERMLNATSQYYAFDVVGCLTYDQDFGFLKKGGDVDGMMGSIEGRIVLFRAGFLDSDLPSNSRILGSSRTSPSSSLLPAWQPNHTKAHAGESKRSKTHQALLT